MDVVVKPSGIHRRGVHALRSFRAGETVLVWDTSQRIAAADAAAHSASGEVFLHPVDAGGFFIVQAPECFVNHSCDNNTEVRDLCDVAIRDIAPGEEVTSDYETDGAGQCFVCECGSPGCRGTIGTRT